MSTKEKFTNFMISFAMFYSLLETVSLHQCCPRGHPFPNRLFGRFLAMEGVRNSAVQDLGGCAFHNRQHPFIFRQVYMTFTLYFVLVQVILEPEKPLCVLRGDAIQEEFGQTISPVTCGKFLHLVLWRVAA